MKASLRVVALLKLVVSIAQSASNGYKSSSTRMSTVMNVLSAVNIATAMSQPMMMSFTITGLCVATIQCNAQMSVVNLYYVKMLMTMWKVTVHRQLLSVISIVWVVRKKYIANV